MSERPEKRCRGDGFARKKSCFSFIGAYEAVRRAAPRSKVWMVRVVCMELWRVGVNR